MTRANCRQTLGRAGEDRAAAWYVSRGYEVVARNWRSRLGEIDLICARDNLLVFCEVKARSTDSHGVPAEAVTRTKQVRLRRLAAEFLHHRTCGCHDVRFDVVAILGSALNVIEGAF
jgi:putative endonuclease